MLNIYIICVGKVKETFFRNAIDEYSKRLSKYCKLQIIELPDEKIPDKINSKLADDIKEKECNNILKHLPKDCFPIALDLKGKEFSSEDFSKNIDALSLKTSSIAFIIGGSLGLTQSLLNECKQSICFSKMTFPHQLIRVFLLEQLFRAFKISNGETYHR